jgi:Mn-dependent DtxR family transcriptional regulator
MEVDKASVYKLIEKNWPAHISEIADQLQIFPGNEAERKRIFEMIEQALQELSNEQKIELRRVGESTIALPKEFRLKR